MMIATRMQGVVSSVMLSLASVAGWADALTSDENVEWVRPSDTLTLDLTNVERVDQHARYAVLVGHHDMSALFRVDGAGGLRYVSGDVPLPSGSHELVVYAIGGGDEAEWTEVHRQSLNVLTASGWRNAEFAPRFDLSTISQLDENHTEDAGPPDRARFTDASLQAGWDSLHSSSRWALRTQGNIVGASEREQALRAAELGDAAPLVDLSDYLLELEVGRGAFAAGHVISPQSPLLISGIDHRGVSYRFRSSERFSVRLAAQNGQRTVGYSRLLGNDISRNHIVSAGLGYELLPTIGALRTELTVMSAKVRSDPGFAIGEVADAERSSGWGFRVSGASDGGRLRGSVDLASSRFRNPRDPALDPFNEVILAGDESSMARAAHFAVDLIRGARLGETLDVSMTLDMQHSRTDPLYRSVAAFVASDNETNAATLGGSLGPVAWQLGRSRAEDNLDDIPTLLKTRTDGTTANWSVPLGSLGGQTRSWLPNLTHSFQRTHQRGINQPPSFDPDTHIPNQITINHDLGLSWTFTNSSLGYSFSLGDQDNRQPGRANADFENRAHSLYASLQLHKNLLIDIGLTHGAAFDAESGTTQTTRGATLAFDWRLSQRFTLRGNYSLTEGDDSAGASDSRDYAAQTELRAEFLLPRNNGRGRPLQVFARHSLVRNTLLDRLFAFDSDIGNWTFTVGASLSLF